MHRLIPVRWFFCYLLDFAILYSERLALQTERQPTSKSLDGFQTEVAVITSVNSPMEVSNHPLEPKTTSVAKLDMVYQRSASHRMEGRSI